MNYVIINNRYFFGLRLHFEYINITYNEEKEDKIVSTLYNNFKKRNANAILRKSKGNIFFKSNINTMIYSDNI